MALTVKHKFNCGLPDDARLKALGGIVNSDWDAEHDVTGDAGEPLIGVHEAPDAAPGNYTLAASGIQIKNADGVEILRIWATDPDTANDYNSANLYIGLEAGFTQPTDNVSAGYNNLGIGYQALHSNTIGISNEAIGFQALFSNTSGYFNTAFGDGSLYANTTGHINTAFGASTLQSNTVGNDNVAFGTQSLVNNISGNNNLAFGNHALQYNITGVYNLGLGQEAGNSEANTDPTLRSSVDTYMVFIGDDATRGGVATSTPLTNGVAIGYGAIVTGSNKAVIGNASLTDAYFGSDAGLAKLHGKGDAIVFPDSDPHVAGAAYWVAGILTKSAG